jgi:hypothetical protein
MVDTRRRRDMQKRSIRNWSRGVDMGVDGMASKPLIKCCMNRN